VISSNGELPTMHCPAPVSQRLLQGIRDTAGNQTDNARSLGTCSTLEEQDSPILRLTWDKECIDVPRDKIGKVDILVVSHHGLFQSSSPAMVDAIAPRIALMNNGAKKGGSTPTFADHRQSARPGDPLAASFSRRRRPAQHPQRSTSRTHGAGCSH